MVERFRALKAWPGLAEQRDSTRLDYLLALKYPEATEAESKGERVDARGADAKYREAEGTDAQDASATVGLSSTGKSVHGSIVLA